MKKCLLIFVQCFVLSTISLSSLYADEQENSPSDIPQTMMQALKQLTGKWKMQVSMTRDNGITWRTMPVQNVDINLIHNGMVLEEKPEYNDDLAFSMLTYISYDQYRKVYRKAAIDDTWGIMDLYEGKIISQKLVFDNIKSATFFPVEPNVWRGFRLTMDMSLTETNGVKYRQVIIDKTDDEGATWQPAFKAKYEKFVVN